MPHFVEPAACPRTRRQDLGSTAPYRVIHVSSDPSACPFCGQALVDKQAVEHLAHQQAAYGVELRRNVEVEVQAGADARIRDLEESLAAETATPTPVAAGWDATWRRLGLGENLVI